MKKLISNWLELIFGLKSKDNGISFIEQKPNIRTTYPNSHVGFNEWAQNLRVSQLYQR
jgi:hypothetical protein